MWLRPLPPGQARAGRWLVERRGGGVPGEPQDHRSRDQGGEVDAGRLHLLHHDGCDHHRYEGAVFLAICLLNLVSLFIVFRLILFVSYKLQVVSWSFFRNRSPSAGLWLLRLRESLGPSAAPRNHRLGARRRVPVAATTTGFQVCADLNFGKRSYFSQLHKRKVIRKPLKYLICTHIY